ncbi:MAG: hypothetical protein IT201_02260 [Thermoleophilia bacterium]|nr:hypothetical protein [Thermoleophilia bacterium]
MGTDEVAGRLSGKLQDFYDSLPADEQALLQAILARAQEDDVSGFSAGDRVRIQVADDAYPGAERPGIVEILF